LYTVFQRDANKKTLNISQNNKSPILLQMNSFLIVKLVLLFAVCYVASDTVMVECPSGEVVACDRGDLTVDWSDPDHFYRRMERFSDCLPCEMFHGYDMDCCLCDDGYFDQCESM
jgi:hypothetical protein